MGYYDLSVLSMSVMGFQKKSLDGGGWLGGWSELYPIFLDFLNFLNFAKPLSMQQTLKGRLLANQDNSSIIYFFMQIKWEFKYLDNANIQNYIFYG